MHYQLEYIIIKFKLIPIQKRNIHISFLLPICEKIIDESLNKEKEISSNISDLKNINFSKYNNK